jgi:hypothetical protein
VRRHYLTDITSRRLGDARQVMVWSEPQRNGHRIDTFLTDLDFPRLISTSRDLNMANCELSINAFFVFWEDTDDEVLTRFLAGVRRCWLRAHFVLVFPERRNPTARDHKCELKAKVIGPNLGRNTFNSDLSIFMVYSGLLPNTTIVPRSGRLCFLQDPCQFVSHPTILRYILTGWEYRCSDPPVMYSKPFLPVQDPLIV